MIDDSSLVEAAAIFHKFVQNTKSLLCPKASFVRVMPFYAQISGQKREKARQHWTSAMRLPSLLHPEIEHARHE
ncbi:MAG: hypothetical protein WA943_08255 [Parvibaculum sp.]|uniref:hypothetical protein n=1 Tax=Parvibaculum sp. TaxID=2024848 RepID=UPI003C736219